MKVVILNNQSRITGGADKHCFELAAQLREHGHEVVFLGTESPERTEVGAFIPLGVTNESRDSIEAHRRAVIAARAVWNRSALGAARQILESFKPDVVHSHKLYPHLSVSPIVTFAKAGVPIVQTVHDYEFIAANTSDDQGGWRDRQENRASYRALNTALFQIKKEIHVPAVSEWVAVSRAVSSIYADNGIETTAIPNFTLMKSEDASDVSSRSGIFFAGRLSEVKGISEVIDVARALPDVQVRIAGGGPLEPEVLRAEEDLPNLEYLGTLKQGELQSELERSRVCLMPSKWQEPGPLASLEAMATGTPLVAYDVGGLSEYIQDAGAGLVVSPPDESLADACSTLLLNEDKWAKASTNGKRAAETTHSVSSYVEKIVDIYHLAVRRVVN
ncbi:MAG TPA: glycosyltransferase family 4 protein [Solirubrobacterales bacterium]|nr:glycosyltransferase family 4 protein [Solirubrobacterales bacterium]